MKKITRILTGLFGGLLSLFSGISGCSDDDAYMGSRPTIAGKVLDGTSGTPISNIRVELLSNTTSLDTMNTISSGEFYFFLNYGDSDKNYTLRITDVDGTDNGGEYQGKTNTFLLDYSTNMTIELDKKP